MSITKSNIPARESKAFEPSSFASRRAARAARGELAERPKRPKRLVSLGIKEQYLEPFGTKARGQTVKIEYFVDMDHSSDYYTRACPNGTLVKMDRGGTDDPKPEYLGVITARGFSSGVFPDSPPDQPPVLLT